MGKFNKATIALLVPAVVTIIKAFTGYEVTMELQGAIIAIASALMVYLVPNA